MDYEHSSLLTRKDHNVTRFIHVQMSCWLQHVEGLFESGPYVKL